MQSSDYLEALAAVDTANPDELQDFLNATQCQPYDNQPDLIPIGSHDEVQYFIQSSDMEIPQDWSKISGQQYDQPRFAGASRTLDRDPIGLPQSPSPSIDSHLRIPPRFFSSWHGTPQGSVGSSTGTSPPYVVSSAGPDFPHEFDDLPPGEDSEADNEFYPGMSSFSAQTLRPGSEFLPDVWYGFGIGRLHHKMPNASRPKDTGFYVICDALDKSIWIAFDFEPYGETGEVDTVRPEYGDPYGHLPGDKHNLVIGVQPIFSEDWMDKRPLSLDRGDPFESSVWGPLEIRLIAQPAYLHEVVKAIREHRRRRIESITSEHNLGKASGTSELKAGEAFGILHDPKALKPRSDKAKHK